MLTINTYKVRLTFTEMVLGTVPKNRQVYSEYLLMKAREIMKRDARNKNVPLADGTEATTTAIDEQLDAEVATVPEVPADTLEERENRGWTSFHRDEQGNFLYNYQVRGFLSAAAMALKEWSPSGKASATDDDEASEEAQEVEEATEAAEGEDGAVPAGVKKAAKKTAKTVKAARGVVKQLRDKVKKYIFVSPRKIRLEESDGTLERPLRGETPLGPRITVVRSDTVAAGTSIEFYIKVLHGGGVTEPLLRDLLAYGELCGLGQWRTGGYGTFEVTEFTKVTGPIPAGV